MLFLLLSLFVLPFAVCQAPEKLQSLLGQLTEMKRVATCNHHRQQEWNHAIAVRVAKRKNELGLSPEQCFKNLKENEGGPSGASGSVLDSKNIREFITSIFHNESIGVKSFFDGACGDWVFMQHVNLSNIAYVGGDISDVTVDENKRCFAQSNIDFVQYDLLCHTPPDVDLMLMRDVLFHFKDQFALKILRNVMASKARYLLTTTFLTANEEHPWQRDRAYVETNHERGQNSTVGFREVNLMDRPFCLPPPIMKVDDTMEYYASLGQPRRYVGLWKLPVPVGQCPDTEIN